MRYAKFFPIFLMLISACGSRMDISTTRGRQAILDSANMYLSNGDCQSAVDVLAPLYGSAYVTDEVRVVQASAQACFSGFQMLVLLSNLTSLSSFYKAIAATVPNTLNDGKITALYNAIDVLTISGAHLSAGQRSKQLNNFMVFLGMATAGAIQTAYGLADAQGNKTVAFRYQQAGGSVALSHVDACAYAASLGFIVDSYNNSDLSSNTQANSAVTSLNTLCAAAGVNCASLNKDRTKCSAAGQERTEADAVIVQTNTNW